MTVDLTNLEARLLELNGGDTSRDHRVRLPVDVLKSLQYVQVNGISTRNLPMVRQAIARLSKVRAPGVRVSATYEDQH